MSELSPTVSVIVPCYNQGIHLDEAIQSVLGQTYQDFEIIIVDDGSDDGLTGLTNDLLRDYRRKRTRVIRTENRGVVSARNTAISHARGKYILPLDADDRIGSEYLEKAVKILDDNPDTGIVYCEVEFFGERQGKWELPPYRFPDILVQNVIFCSGFFRKSDWEKVDGYNPNMNDGWEDYDFWLAIIETGRKVYRISEILFYYRQKKSSRNTEASSRAIALHTRIFQNHRELYLQNIEILFKYIYENWSKIDELREVIHENRLTVEELGEQLDDFVAQRDRAILRIQQLEDHERELEQELSKTQKDFLNARREVEELTEAIRPLQEMRESKLGTMLALWHEFKKKIGF